MRKIAEDPELAMECLIVNRHRFKGEKYFEIRNNIVGKVGERNK